MSVRQQSLQSRPFINLGRFGKHPLGYHIDLGSIAAAHQRQRFFYKGMSGNIESGAGIQLMQFHHVFAFRVTI